MMSDLPSAAQAYRILLQEETHLQLRTSGGGLNETMACRADKTKFYKKGTIEGNMQKETETRSQHCGVNTVK